MADFYSNCKSRVISHKKFMKTKIFKKKIVKSKKKKKQ